MRVAAVFHVLKKLQRMSCHMFSVCLWTSCFLFHGPFCSQFIVFPIHCLPMRILLSRYLVKLVTRCVFIALVPCQSMLTFSCRWLPFPVLSMFFRYWFDQINSLANRSVSHLSSLQLPVSVKTEIL